ncbi:MAG: hypothetical protein LC753_14250 [Acidobacteria bacterium]|nr:hypothetical protein [Acidobacteriota bacterium]MCA1651380.1 hypothetical protein [Acidobacteriota bacterium]
MTRHNTTALARELDFGGIDDPEPSGSRPSGLRLAPIAEGLRRPDKYKVLAHRRRQAQIAARRLLGLMEEGNHV